jgi:hypothetical protein
MPGVERYDAHVRRPGTWCKHDQHAARIHLQISQQKNADMHIRQAKHHGIQKMQFNSGIELRTGRLAPVNCSRRPVVCSTGEYLRTNVTAERTAAPGQRRL